MCFAKYDKELYAQIIEELDNTKWSGDDESHNLAPRFYPVKKKSIIIDIRQFGKPFGIRQNKNKTWTVYAKDKNHDISWNYATLSRALARFKIMVNNSGYYSRRAEKNSIKVYNEVKQLLKKHPC